jgi:hypothetical protein
MIFFAGQVADDVLPPSPPRTMPWRAMGRRGESVGLALEKV